MHGLIHSDYIQQALHAPVCVTPLRLQRQQRLWAFSVAGNFFWNTSLGKFIKWGLRKELRNLIFKSNTLLRKKKKKLPKWFRHTDSTENLRHLKTGLSPIEIYQNVYQKVQPNSVACTTSGWWHWLWVPSSCGISPMAPGRVFNILVYHDWNDLCSCKLWSASFCNSDCWLGKKQKGVQLNLSQLISLCCFSQLSDAVWAF